MEARHNSGVSLQWWPLRATCEFELLMVETSTSSTLDMWVSTAADDVRKEGVVLCLGGMSSVWLLRVMVLEAMRQ